MLTALLVCVLVAAGTLLFAWLRHRFAYWQRRGVAFVPPSVPFGNYAAAMLGRKNLCTVNADVYRDYRGERFVGTFFAMHPMLQIHDPEIIRHVFTKEFQDFNGRGMHCDPVNDPLSGHLFILSGQHWRNMRVKLSPTFTTGKIKYMFSTIDECARYLDTHVESSMARGGGAYDEDIRELVARFSTDIISSVAFGIQSNSMQDPHSEFRRMGQKIFAPTLEVSTRNLLLFFAPDVMRALSVRCVPRDVYAFFTRIVDEMVLHREQNGVERADMLNLLIKLKNEGFVPPDAEERNGADGGKHQDDGDRERLTQGQIAAQVFVFFVAGFETTSTTTSFTLFELAKHPDIQAKVQQEVDAVLQKCGGKLSYEAVMDMPYSDMVIQETMRLFPPIPFLTRQAMVARKLPLTEVQLEKGLRLMIPVISLHKDPQYWPDPERYDPLRFTEEAKKTRPATVYLPFGDGPRICIGMRLGLVQVKVALATILSKATVSLAPGMKAELELSPRCIIPTPVGGIRLTLTAR